MTSATRLATALAGVATCANAASAAFTFSIGTPNTTLIPGKIVLQLYALNTGVGGTGTQIKAFAPVFTATGGGFFVNADDAGTPGDASDDTIDLVNAGGPTPTLTSAGNGFSYIRQGTAAQTFQVSVTPGLADLYNTSTGIRSFSVTETTTGTVQASSTVNGGLGFRVAVLVLSNTSYGFTLSGQVGGDTGTAQTIPTTYFGGHVDPFEFVTITPLTMTVDLSRGVTSFSGVTIAGVDYTSAGYPSFLTHDPFPAQIADNLILVQSGVRATLSGANFTAADVGTYALRFTAYNSSGLNATDTFTLRVVIPEPATLAAFGACGTVVRRRRMSPGSLVLP